MKKKYCLTLSLVILMISFSCGKRNDPNTGYQDLYHLNLRDTGPAGGLIFYINPNADHDGWKYLEAAFVDHPVKEWGTYGLSVSGADGTLAGTGKQNTLDITGFDTSSMDKAADICLGYNVTFSGSVYEDWFLPSKDELNLMYENLHLHGVGGFSADFYWSSSEADPNKAWTQLFSNGLKREDPKNYIFNIRAVRGF